MLFAVKLKIPLVLINSSEAVQYLMVSFRDGAVIWMMFLITRSPLDVALITVAKLLSGWIAPISGSLVDSWNLRRVINWTNLLRALLCFGTSFALDMKLSFVITIYLFYILLGVVNKFYYPAFFTAYNKLLDNNARFKNMSVTNSIIMAANVVGALFIAIGLHLDMVFALCGVAYLYAYVILKSAFRQYTGERVAPPKAQLSLHGLSNQLRDLNIYLKNNVGIVVLGLLGLVPEIGIKMVDMLTPKFAVNIGMDHREFYSLLLSVFSGGASVAGLASALWRTKDEVKRLVFLYLLSAAIVTCVGLVQNPIIDIALYAVLGGSFMVENNARHALRVSLTDFVFNGRISSISNTLVSNTVALVSVAVGWVAGYVPVRTIYVLWGPATFCIVLPLLLKLRSTIGSGVSQSKEESV
ncbi:MFS transporter [Alicyclobacillus hesperidum]